MFNAGENNMQLAQLYGITFDVVGASGSSVLAMFAMPAGLIDQ